MVKRVYPDSLIADYRSAEPIDTFAVNYRELLLLLLLLHACRH